MGKLYIECLEKRFGWRKIASAVYKTLGQKDNLKAELVFVAAEDIKKLNMDTRGVDKVTDVLSYPNLDGIKGEVLAADDHLLEMDGKYIFIGSVVLCEDKIKEQAKEYGHSEERERTYLIVHGLMHLMGYDHMTAEDKAEMREKEKAALALLGIED